jgi:hypothetical protein
LPPVNAELVDRRLLRSKLDVLDAGHFTWEDVADEDAALVTSWRAAAVRRPDLRQHADKGRRQIAAPFALRGTHRGLS